MKKLSVLFICFLLTKIGLGINIYVQDPRTSWERYTATIEEASLEVKPVGLYMEYGLYLSFSSRNTRWVSEKDTVELVMDFELPQNAVIIDSWLWIGNEIKRADILDRWTASSIYESIVKRRRDPSVLYKQTQTNYQLRIFPMAGNEVRKVKITFLSPVEWNKNTVIAKLPFDFLLASKSKVPQFAVSVFEKNGFTAPFIFGNDNLKFETSGSFKKIVFKPEYYIALLKIGYTAPVKNGFYFAGYRNNDSQQGFYQLAIFPSQFLNSEKQNNIAVLVDFDVTNTSRSAEDILAILKSQMQGLLRNGDRFNLIYSNMDIKRHSETWVDATSYNIESAFQVMKGSLGKYSNLSQLLLNGIDFIRKNGKDAKIVLLTNSDQYYKTDLANSFIKDILSRMNPVIPIHISDFQNTNLLYNYTGGINYMGNEYLYTNLSKMTGGSYNRVMSGKTEDEVIGASFRIVNGTINSFDLHTKLKSGFTYGRYNIPNTKIIYLNDAIAQVGKFNGTFPMDIDFSGDFNGKLFSYNFNAGESDLANGDSLNEEVWVGQYLRDLEMTSYSTDIIKEVITTSIKERVLSTYTAFICVENNIQLPTSDADTKNRFTDTFNGIPTNTKEVDNVNKIRVYPNPFSGILTVELNLAPDETLKEMVIVDMKGVVVHTFTKYQTGFEGKITWNGKLQNGVDLPVGIYFLMVKTTQGNKVVKLVKH